MKKAPTWFLILMTLLLLAPTVRAENALIPDADAASPGEQQEGEEAFIIADAVIEEIAQNPELIGQHIQLMNEEQVAELIIRVIIHFESSGVDDGQIRAGISTMLSETTKSRGANFGTAVLTRIRKRVHPRLLPTISVGSAPAPPPAPAPKYTGQ